MDKPCSHWFAIENAQGNGAIQGLSYKKGRFGQGRVQEIGGSTRVYERRYRVGKARNLNEDKKGDFRVRGESCADSDQVYRGIGSFMYSWRGVLGNNAIQVAHLWRRIMFQFPKSMGLLDYLPDGCIGLASDGKDGPTDGGRLGMPRIATVWGSHIDGEGTIVAESLDVLLFAFHFCEL